MSRVAVVGVAEWRPSSPDDAPDVSFVPALARRRLTPVERAAFAVARRAFDDAHVADDEEVPTVFASRWGEIGTTFRLMRQFHDEGEMSPAGFSSSVHNAGPGAWSLFRRDHAPYTAVAAGERTFGAGLVEALAQAEALAPGRKVLFVFAEEATPEFYRGAFPGVVEPHAFACVFERVAG